MSRTTRRDFFTGATAGMTAAALWPTSQAGAAGAANRVRVGVIGCGQQGKNHMTALASLKDVELVSICDIDQQRLAKAADLAPSAKPVGDLRRILDDPSIDAVTLPVPDHWHVPAALLAIDAGKHVYVEKPCSHFEQARQVRSPRRPQSACRRGTRQRRATGRGGESAELGRLHPFGRAAERRYRNRPPDRHRNPFGQHRYPTRPDITV